MPSFPSDLRSNKGTWLVPGCRLPELAAYMVSALSPEPFDIDFQGQRLRTTYFDSADADLLRARRQGDRYLTLRIRAYLSAGSAPMVALSAKTESQKSASRSTRAWPPTSSKTA